MKQFWTKTQSSYIFELSELLIPDDDLKFSLFLKSNNEMLNKKKQFKENLSSFFSDKKLPSCQ